MRRKFTLAEVLLLFIALPILLITMAVIVIILVIMAISVF